MKEITFNSIEGMRIGNSQKLNGPTGCTVLVFEEGASAGVDVRGGSPGTRETDLLNPVNLVDKIHAVVLAGGSAFGLDAAGGVMQYLEEKSIGFDVSVTKVPIVCGAVLFDLNIGDFRVRPDKTMGYEACKNSELNLCENGNVGAGAGATVGKILGNEHAMKGGLGTFAIQVGELKVGAVVAVNCLGDVIDSKSQSIIAGALNEDKKSFAGTEKVMLKRYSEKKNLFSGNTTIGAVVTNGNFTKTQMNKVASMAHNGYGRAIRPAHSMFDGDTIFAASCGKIEADLSVVGFLAAEVMEKAIVRAVKSADSILQYKSYKDL
ncbi:MULTISPECIES: P1 family peptidase [Clostridium]|uniref:Peptidase family S58 n=3 Tax=Clostridium TaxID=1485 RepID=D8GNP0_CLOLD|nr:MULTISPECIES: P1 family peptidase [Clostridium]ADK15903.1 putative peptidase [Clostridium ljungdahlii DSM 13528]AGY75076.1 P1 family peptidase [Clostridium autoethanogenum DSM 10061]ALU35249.1 Peptidase S58 DmpA [Clostridium autoethanogenum DSM 10061]OAA87219.1 Peptidase family S58 [Clostridium ljungdahlii DSM 13528]OAA93704.1 Peptidase family S58 [Clostridium coskatii]